MTSKTGAAPATDADLPRRFRRAAMRSGGRRRARLGQAALALATAAAVPAGLGITTATAATAAQPRVASTHAAVPAPSTEGASSPYTQAAGSIVAEAAVPGGGGYWSVTANGLVTPSGSAVSYGDAHTLALAKPIVGMSATADGKGYWLVASDGGIFAYGDAAFHGSTGNIHLNQPIVGMATAPGGNGYWLVASDGGIFAFGTAQFHGSTGNIHLNKPVVGMSATADGGGYWMVATDGGIFAFGDAPFVGSTGNLTLAQPVIGMATTPAGNGYWLVASDGGVFAFNAPFYGSLGGTAAGVGTVGILPEGGGYWILSGAGGATAFNAPTVPVSNVPIVSQLPAGADPASNTAPSAAFQQSCFSGENNAGCDSAALANINQARADEGYGPLALPANYESLSQNAQIEAVSNAERTSRGLSAISDNVVDDALALVGANDLLDPSGPANTNWASILSDGYATPLAADFAWMYDDGPGGTNSDCTAAGQAGCWGHRNNILVPWAQSAGTGIAIRGGLLVLTELFTG